MRLSQPIPTFLALVPYVKQKRKRLFRDSSVHICRHSRKLVALTENLNPAIQLNGTKNAQIASPDGSQSLQGERTGTQPSVYTWFSLSLLLGKKFLLKRTIMIWGSKEDGRRPELTLSSAAKALHTSHPVFLADD